MLSALKRARTCLPSLLHVTGSARAAHGPTFSRLPSITSAAGVGAEVGGRALFRHYARLSHAVRAAAAPAPDRLLLPAIEARLLSATAASSDDNVIVISANGAAEGKDDNLSLPAGDERPPSDGATLDSDAGKNMVDIFPIGRTFLTTRRGFAADKTKAICDLLGKEQLNAALYRPRRQGKTWTLEQMEALLSPKFEEEAVQAAFKGMWIMQKQQRPRREALQVGKHNVLKLDLSDWADASSAEEANELFESIISVAVREFWAVRFPHDDFAAFCKMHRPEKAVGLLRQLAMKCVADARSGGLSGNGGKLTLLVDEFDQLHTRLVSESDTPAWYDSAVHAATKLLAAEEAQIAAGNTGELQAKLVGELKPILGKCWHQGVDKALADAVQKAREVVEGVEKAKAEEKEGGEEEVEKAGGGDAVDRLSRGVLTVIDNTALGIDRRDLVDAVVKKLTRLYQMVKKSRDQFGFVVTAGIAPVLMDRLGTLANLNEDYSQLAQYEGIIGLDEEEVAEALVVAHTAARSRAHGSFDRNAALDAGWAARKVLRAVSKREQHSTLPTRSRSLWMPEALLLAGLAADNPSAAAAVQLTTELDKHTGEIWSGGDVVIAESIRLAHQLLPEEVVQAVDSTAVARELEAHEGAVRGGEEAEDAVRRQLAWQAGLAEMTQLLDDYDGERDASSVRMWWRQQPLFGGVAGDLEYLRRHYNGYRFATNVQSQWDRERRLYGSQLVMTYLNQLVDLLAASKAGEPPSWRLQVDSTNLELSQHSAELLVELDGSDEVVRRLLKDGKVPLWDPPSPKFERLSTASEMRACMLLYYFGAITSAYEGRVRTHLRVTNQFARDRILHSLETKLEDAGKGKLAKTVRHGLETGLADGGKAMLQALHMLSTTRFYAASIAKTMDEGGKLEDKHARAFDAAWLTMGALPESAMIWSEDIAKKLDTGNDGYIDTVVTADGLRVVLERKAPGEDFSGIVEEVESEVDRFNSEQVRTALGKAGREKLLAVLDNAVGQVSHYDVQEEEGEAVMRVVAVCLPNRKALVYHVTEEERVRVLKEAEEERERRKRRKREEEERRKRRKREEEERREREKKEEEERREREKKEWERARVLSNPDTPIEEWLEAVQPALGDKFADDCKTAFLFSAVDLVRANVNPEYLESIGIASGATRIIMEAVDHLKE